MKLPEPKHHLVVMVKSKKAQTWNMRIPKELKSQLKEVSERTGVKESEIVRRLLIRFLSSSKREQSVWMEIQVQARPE